MEDSGVEAVVTAWYERCRRELTSFVISPIGGSSAALGGRGGAGAAGRGQDRPQRVLDDW